MKHVYIDKYSHLDSPLHRMDPRLKIIACFTAIVIIISAPADRLLDYALFFPLVLLLIPLSRVPLQFILKKCLLLLPIILAAALLLPLSSGVFSLSDLSAYPYHAPLALFLKAYSALILLILLTSTERFDQLLYALRRLKMPAIIVQISALLYRYSFIFLDEVLKTSRARSSRTPGKISSNRVKVYGNQAAIIFIRSWDRAHVIHQSMMARGFNGEMPSLSPGKINTQNLVPVLLFVAVLMIIRFNHNLVHWVWQQA